jgi:hypothetical protein
MPRSTCRTLPTLVSSMVLVGVLAGCGQTPAPTTAGATARATGSAATAAAPIPAASATSTATTTTPVPLSPAAAGKRYLEITRPYNVALEAFERGFNAGESVRTLQRRARAAADAVGAEAAGLDAAAWPESVAPLVDDLVQNDGLLRRAWLAIAAADTRDAMLAKVRKLPSGARVGAEIRVLLGLPEYNEDDYRTA